MVVDGGSVVAGQSGGEGVGVVWVMAQERGEETITLKWVITSIYIRKMISGPNY